jgi:hypothetical protein
VIGDPTSFAPDGPPLRRRWLEERERADGGLVLDVEFEIGTPDTEGLLRASRQGAEDGDLLISLRRPRCGKQPNALRHDGHRAARPAALLASQVGSEPSSKRSRSHHVADARYPTRRPSGATPARGHGSHRGTFITVTEPAPRPQATWDCAGRRMSGLDTIVCARCGERRYDTRRREPPNCLIG